MLLQFAPRVRRHFALECATTLSVSLDPSNSIRADPGEPTTISLRYFRPNHDRTLRELDVVPLEFLKFSVRVFQKF